MTDLPAPDRGTWGVLADSVIALEAARPVVGEMASRGHRLDVIVPQGLLGVASEMYGERDLRVLPLPRTTPTRLRASLHVLLSIGLSERESHRSYQEYLRYQAVARKPRFGRLVAATRPIARVTWSRVNGLLSKASRTLRSGSLPYERLLVVSRTRTPSFVPGTRRVVVTLIESWDHHCAHPVGYRTDAVISWTRDLGERWEAMQGGCHIIEGYPWKLEYALTAHLPPRPAIADGRVLMYAPVSSQRSLRPARWEAEAALIEAIASATAVAGWKLLIKPRPAGDRSEYEDLCTRWDHVSLGHFGGASNDVSYRLDDEYNRTRLSELAGVDAVCTAGTTFALDAACAGRPLIHIDLRQCTDFNALGRAQNNEHLQVLAGLGPTIAPSDATHLNELLTTELAGDLTSARAMSAAVQAWVTPSRMPADAASHVADQLETMTQPPRRMSGRDEGPVPVRFVILSTVLQATTTAAALATDAESHGPDERTITIGIVTEGFERGDPSGLDVVGSLLPSLEVHVIRTLPGLQQLIDEGWQRSIDPTGAEIDIWSANPTGYLTRHLLRAYPRATLTLTEDGLATQMLRFDRSTRLPSLRGLGLRHYRVRLRKHGLHLVRASFFGLRRREAHRLRRAFHLLPPPTIVGGPPVELIQLSPESVREALTPLGTFFPTDRLAIAGARCIVVLGQVFASSAQSKAPGSIAEPDHPTAYLELMQRLRSAGFDVLWKAHPRDRHGQRLMQEAQGGTADLPYRELDVGAAPMELLIMHNPTVPVVGMGSASLVYGRVLFDAPTFRMSHARYRGALGDVVAAALPDEQELIDRGPR